METFPINTSSNPTTVWWWDSSTATTGDSGEEKSTRGGGDQGLHQRQGVRGEQGKKKNPRRREERSLYMPGATEVGRSSIHTD